MVLWSREETQTRPVVQGDNKDFFQRGILSIFWKKKLTYLMFEFRAVFFYHWI